MTAEKFALKTTFRRPAGFVLFALVLAALACMLVLGLSIRGAIVSYLSECDAYYHSVAELEYVGREYPDPHVYDGELEAYLAANPDFMDSLTALPGVIGFEPDSAALAVVPGVHRKDKYVDDKFSAVLTVKVTVYDENKDGYAGIISECLYSREDNTGKMIFLRRNGGEDYRKGETYVISGRYFEGGTSYLWFAPYDSEVEQNGTVEPVPGCSLLEGELPADSPYRIRTAILAERNNAFRLKPTTNLENLIPWQQEELTVAEGRVFTEAEYRNDAAVCIVPARLMEIADYRVGDLLPLQIGDYGGGLYDALSAELQPEKNYEIVGFYVDSEKVPDTVYVPVSHTEAFTCPTGFSLGVFRLENTLAEDFLAQAKAQLTPAFSLKLYDQGYSVTAGPYRELLRIANLFLAVVCAAIAAVLLVYGYLSVLRRREEALLQMALGSGKLFMLRTFLLSALLLLLPAVPAGIIAARRLETSALELLAEFVRSSSEADLRFSVSHVALLRTLEFDPVPDRRLSGLGAVLLCAAVLLVTAAFALLSVRTRKPKKKPVCRVHTRAGHTFRFGGRWRYGLISLLRGGVRSAFVLLLGCVIALLFCRLSSTENAYREQLEEIRRNTEIRGYVSDVTGKKLGNIVVNAENVQTLFDSGAADRMELTRNKTHCRFLGVSKTAAGTAVELEEPVIPTDGFGIETLANQLAGETPWVTTTSISVCPQLYYDASPRVTWLEGYGEASLRGPCAAVCVLPETMLEREQIALGDTVRFLSYTSGRGVHFFEVDLLCVGSYGVSSGSETIYTPFEYNFPIREDAPVIEPEVPDVRYPYVGAGFAIPAGISFRQLTLSSVIFTVSDPARLGEVRQLLEDASFAEPGTSGRVRNYAVLDDWGYLSAVQGMERQLRYLNGLYSVLYVLTMLVAAAASWLLLNARRNELAIMRALGTPTLRAAATFLLEQLLLCGVGLSCGLLLWRFTEGTPTDLSLRLTGLWFGLWLLGTSVNLFRLLTGKAAAALKERE